MAVSRRTLIERINRFLGTMERARRQPDEWEGQCLLQALTDLAQGDVPHAEEMTILAKTAPDQRTAGKPPGTAASLPHPTVSELRTRLQSVQLETN